jgi:5-hydroxyisourate hydrolase-like protein (transthyretin family)
VVDLTTGKPAAGVNLDRYIEVPGTRSLDSATVVSDENGKFSTTVAPGSNVSFQWRPSREGKYIIDQEWQQGGDGGGGNYQPFRQQVVSKSQTDLVFKVKLWPVAPLKGQVTDAQGKPVDGASVCMHSEVEPVKTDKDGRFTLAVAPTDRDYDLLAISAKKDLAAIVHVTKGAAAATIALEPTRDYQGEVKTEDGLPAPKLKFYMDVKINKSSIYRAREEPTTDAAGTFTAKNLCPKGAYSISWSGDNEENRAYDYGNAEADLTKIAEGEPIRFKAKMYVNALMGRVVDVKKEPVVGAKVEPQPSELMRQDDRQNPKPVVTGKDGSFTVERLAAGVISLRVSATGYKTKSFKARTDDVDFTAALPAPKTGVGLTFAVTVKDEQGQPVEGAPLELRTQVYGSSKATTASVTQKTDASGRTQFAFAGLKEKQSGRGYIVCDAPGHNLGFCSAGRLDEDLDAVIALEKEGKTWRGRVVDAEHKPIAGAKLQVGAMRLGEGNEGYVSMQEADAPACASDADGRFELKRISPNFWISIRVHAEGYSDERQSLDPKRDGDKEREFVLQPAGTIQGKIVAEGGEVPAGKWGVYASQPAGNSPGRNAKVEPDGTFVMTGVKGGTYTVMASAASTETLRWVCSQAPSVDVVAGQTSTVEIQVQPGIELKCKIVRPQGATGEAEKVRTVFAKPSEDRDGNGLGGLPDSEGNWRLYLPEGTFELNYALEGKPPVPTGQKITVTKGKPLDEIVIEVK